MNVRVAFKTLEYGMNVPVGYQFMEMHMVFDVKFEAVKKGWVRFKGETGE